MSASPPRRHGRVVTAQQQVAGLVLWGLAAINVLSTVVGVVRSGFADRILLLAALQLVVAAGLFELGRRVRGGSRPATLVATILASVAAALNLLVLLGSGSFVAALQFFLALYVAVTCYLALRSVDRTGVPAADADRPED